MGTVSDRTPRSMVRLRMAIIGAMLAGRITYVEAMELQAMQSNIELTMAASAKGVDLC